MIPRITIYLQIVFLFLSCQSNDKWQEKVDKINSLHTKYYDAPEHFLNDTLYRLNNDFNATIYFKILENIESLPNKEIDYIYYYDEYGGTPLLYFRNSKSNSISTLSEYQNIFDVELPEVTWRPKHLIENEIIIKDTEDGFFEFCIFKIMAGQFYHYWHDLYNDTTVVCDIKFIENEIQQMYKDRMKQNKGEVGLGINTDTLNKHTIAHYDTLLQKIKIIDYKPKIFFYDDKVIIKLIVYSKFGGLLEKTLIIQRKFPHKIIKEKNNSILEFSVGYAL